MDATQVRLDVLAPGTCGDTTGTGTGTGTSGAGRAAREQDGGVEHCEAHHALLLLLLRLTQRTTVAVDSISGSRGGGEGRALFALLARPGLHLRQGRHLRGRIER